MARTIRHFVALSLATVLGAAVGVIGIAVASQAVIL